MDLDPQDAQLLKVVGANIRAERARRDWSQEELAHQAGIRHQSLISPLERGQTRAGLVTYARIARALGVPLTSLFEGVDEP